MLSAGLSRAWMFPGCLRCKVAAAVLLLALLCLALLSSLIMLYVKAGGKSPKKWFQPLQFSEGLCNTWFGTQIPPPAAAAATSRQMSERLAACPGRASENLPVPAPSLLVAASLQGSCLPSGAPARWEHRLLLAIISSLPRLCSAPHGRSEVSACGNSAGECLHSRPL